MVHATRDGLSQNSDCCIDIAGRPPYQLVSISPRELHRTVAHTVHRYRRAGQSEAAGQINLFNHFVPPGAYVVCSEENWKDSPTSSSLFFQSASAFFASSAYPRTPSLTAVMVVSSGTVLPT